MCMHQLPATAEPVALVSPPSSAPVPEGLTAALAAFEIRG